MGFIISVVNHKGGVGKTASAANIGAALALKGHRTLLIDLDPQANLSTSYGIDNPDKTVYGALRKEYALPVIKAQENLYLTASSIDLSAAEMELSSEPGREYLLQELIEQIEGDYKFILIDCPPSLGLLTINALTASNCLLIPLQAEFLAMRGLKKLIEVVEKIQKRLNKELNLAGVFLTRYDNRKTLNRSVHETAAALFPGKVYKTAIRNNIAIAEAPANGKDIFSYDNKSNGAQDYKALTEELLRNLKNK